MNDAAALVQQYGRGKGEKRSGTETVRKRNLGNLSIEDRAGIDLIRSQRKIHVSSLSEGVKRRTEEAIGSTGLVGVGLSNRHLTASRTGTGDEIRSTQAGKGPSTSQALHWGNCNIHELTVSE